MLGDTNNQLPIPLYSQTSESSEDWKVKLNASDPTAGYLDDKITGYGFLTQSSGDLRYYPLSSNPAGYLTSSSLTGYATQSWVNSQGYVTGTPWASMGYLTKAVADGYYQPIGTYLTPSSTLDPTKLSGYPSDGTKFLAGDGTWKAVIGGTSDHSLLSNLDYAHAGHTGFQPTITTGSTSQYLRGDLSLANFPTIPSVGTWGALNYPAWTSGTPFVKMTAAGTFALDTNTYLTSQTYPGAGIAVSTGSAWGTSLTAPSSTIVGTNDIQTLNYKRITLRTGSTTSSATPAINTDNYDLFLITAQAANITSMSSSLTGTPTDGQKLSLRITGTGTYSITWGASFENSNLIALPTTNAITTTMTTYYFEYISSTSKWRLQAQN